MVITTNIKNLAWQSQVFAIYFVSAMVLSFKGNVWNYEFNEFNESTKQDNERKHSANEESLPVNHNKMEISVLHNRTVSVSHSIDFGIQSHWVWPLKSLSLAAKSMEIEIQPQ